MRIARPLALALGRAAPLNPPVFTIVVHGSFAAAGSWWRPSTAGSGSSFADQLEDELARRGLAGTVWKPAVAVGLGPDDFAWSGDNTHAARTAGSKRLAASLAELARRLGATAETPLIVNAVAHSHGGNVVLEAVRRLHGVPEVRFRQLVFLGTPLIEFRAALRPFRFLVAVLILAGALGLATVIVARLFLPQFPRLICPLLGTCAEEHVGAVVSWPWLVAALFGVLLVSRWVFAIVAALGDALWRVAYLPVLMARGRAHGQAYGPAPQSLRASLSGRRVLLITSHQDEADLLFHASAAPRKVYEEWIGEAFSAWGRALEWLVVRPVVVGVLLRAFETVMERVAFGFSWLRVLFFDHDMAELETSRAYPTTLIERADFTEEMLEAHRAGAALMHPAEAAGLKGEERRVASLRHNLGLGLRKTFLQIHPQHSDYYRTPAITERVAEAIAAGDPALRVGAPRSAPSGPGVL